MNPQKIIIILVSLLLTACTTTSQQDKPPKKQIDVSKIANAKPKKENRSKYGNPYTYTVYGKHYYVLPSSKNYHATGIASWYGMKFHDHLTANRETYDVYKMTAAHKTLPIPSYVKVTNLENGKQVIVRINDRGPFKDNRIIDLSYAAAKKLDIVKHGTGLVRIDSIDINKTTVTHSPQIYLQVGAYSKLNHARYMQQEISSKIAAPCEIMFNGADRLYHVKIGPINNRSWANDVTTKLAALNITKTVTMIK
ncbi:MAG: septal ring lytic transglycosylase RlpA family protein [Gammaproteobacteria bacterium]|jgi:rare lipoprotein A